MTGDYTRDTFRRWRHYSAVREQQGRVHMDADWNEQIDIGHHLTRTTNVDVIGPTGMPEASRASPSCRPLPARRRSADRPWPRLCRGRAGGASAGRNRTRQGFRQRRQHHLGGGIRPRLNRGNSSASIPNPATSLSRVSAIEPAQQADQGRQRLRFDPALGSGQNKRVVPLASTLVQPFFPGFPAGHQRVLPRLSRCVGTRNHPSRG